MTSNELRKQFLDFFEKKGHKIVPSSLLIPTDPSVLFTAAGMQQFKEYFLEKKSPYGSQAASCQKCFRTSDIGEVGDESHLTFLEMLGNFSFGEYFKEEAIKLAYDFLFERLKLPKEEAVITVFEGDKEIPFDEESVLFWKKLGISDNKIKKGNKKDNFWGPTGKEGPCGPTSEIHFNGIEVWNLVFNEYYQNEVGKLTPLKQKGVDTGMGLERLAMIAQNKSSIFEIDLFSPIINEISGINEKAKRIISDHIKGAAFLISEGIFPSNVERGYILRRILRRAIRYGKLLNLPGNFLIPLAQKVIEIYKEAYPELKSKESEILTVIQDEEEKFSKTLEKGIKVLNSEMRVLDYQPSKKIEDIPDLSSGFTPHKLTGKWLFDLYQTFGFPLELSLEELKNRGKKLSDLELDNLKKEFEEEIKKHQEISRAGAEKKFGGVGKGATLEAAKLHSATHLLHSALRQILGHHVQQMGSDITSQRLRFDFSYSQKLTSEEIKKVEDLVNQKIEENLEVKKEEMPLKEAMDSGALSFFKGKYPEKVTVYTIGTFSREICAGPHINKISELGHFKIVKEESAGAGIRRIRGILE